MNPVNPFSGQQPGAFAVSSSATGTFQTKSPFRFGQPSLFGQNNQASKSLGFSQVPSFATPSGGSHSSSLPAFGLTQTSSVGLFSGLESTPSFAATSGPSSSSVPGNTAFSFKSASSVGVFPSGPTFGPETGDVAGSGFRKTEFKFKPLENAVFKPILGAESEPEKTQSQIASGFFTFSHPVSSGSGGLTPFSFPQVTNSSATSSSFIFSKPVTSNTSAFAPALSNQNIEEEKRGPKSVFGGLNSSFSTFPMASPGSLGEPFPTNKTSIRQGGEEAISQVESHPALMKGLKRKEDQDRSPRRHCHEAAEDSDPLSRGDHPPDKRPVRLNRPRGGTLFGRTIQEVFKSNKEAGRLGSKESKKDSGFAESGESDHVAIPGGSQSTLVTSRLPAVNKEEETEGRDEKEGGS